jgi:hypothetical protein
LLIFVGGQKEEAVYACELCQKHGKVIESNVAENGEQQDILPQVELKTISSDTILSPHLHGGQGKVCLLITWIVLVPCLPR